MILKRDNKESYKECKIRNTYLEPMFIHLHSSQIGLNLDRVVILHQRIMNFPLLKHKAKTVNSEFRQFCSLFELYGIIISDELTKFQTWRTDLEQLELDTILYI
jgi:hypothetical protein